MNELEYSIVATLRAEAEEASMRTDTKNEFDTLETRLDQADHRRRTARIVWGCAAAAAVVVGVAAGVVLRGSTTGANPPTVATPTPSLPAMHIATSTLSPNVELDLPGWTAYGQRDSWAKDAIRYPQSVDGPPFANGQDRNFMLITPSYFYPPQDHTTMVTKPTYAGYVAAWDSLESAGMGTIRDRRSTTVAGRPAVMMTVDFTSAAEGLAACETDIQVRSDCWNTAAGRTARVAIIDGGAAGPLVLFDAMNTDNPDTPVLVAEMDSVLATVRLG